MKFLKRIFLLGLTFLLMSSLLLAGLFLIKENNPAKGSGITREAGSAGSAAAEAPDKAPEPAAQTTLKVDEIRDSGLLRLVSSRYATKEVKASRLAKTANGKFKLRKDILAEVEAFFAFARKEANDLYFTSAFRSIEEQTAIYQKTANKGLVQKPGFSEHHTGLALDLMPRKSLKGEQGKDLLKEQEFMAEHSWQYGLVKRYPAGKEAITGIDHEFWHFRYVGQPHAAYMHKKGLVLEEYLELLESAGELAVTHQGESYAVYWRKAEAGEIAFPKASDFEISSTNTGAWVITVRQD